MKRVTAAVMVCVMVLSSVQTQQVQAESSPVLITALQTGGLQNAGQELIELTNLSSEYIDLKGYRLEYFSANPKNFTTPSRAISLTGTIAPSATFTLKAIGYDSTGVQQTFSATLAAAGGHLRLSRSGQELDFIGWGTAVGAHGQALPAPEAGEVVHRIQNLVGEYSNTGNNAVDFGVEAVPQSGPGVGIGNIILSELLPNPASPATDATGEYIELYNAGEITVQLEGYKLLAGPSLGKSYTFPSVVLGTGEYKAFYITDTKLSLSNSASKVQLQSPQGEVLSEVQYDGAVDGQAYAWDGIQWQWTAVPTPNAANTVSLPSAASSTKSAKPTSKKATTAKAKKGSVKGASTIAKSTKSEKSQIQPKPPLHTGVVAGVGGAAVLYGAYEYRQDVISFYRKLRGHRKNR